MLSQCIKEYGECKVGLNYRTSKVSEDEIVVNGYGFTAETYAKHFTEGESQESKDSLDKINSLITSQQENNTILAEELFNLFGQRDYCFGEYRYWVMMCHFLMESGFIVCGNLVAAKHIRKHLTNVLLFRGTFYEKQYVCILTMGEWHLLIHIPLGYKYAERQKYLFNTLKAVVKGDVQAAHKLKMVKGDLFTAKLHFTRPHYLYYNLRLMDDFLKV